jgi:hypothetical protein
MATIIGECNGADYTKPVIEADLVEEFRMECLTIEDVQDIAAGIVPSSIQATAKQLLDFADMTRRNAQKPVRQAKSKTRKRRIDSPVMHEIAETAGQP